METLESLKYLDLSGNNLSSIDELLKLRPLQTLTQLKLSDKLSCNPLCLTNRNYIRDIQQILPNLEVIDGEIVNSASTKTLTHTFERIMKEIQEIRSKTVVLFIQWRLIKFIWSHERRIIQCV